MTEDATAGDEMYLIAAHVPIKGWRQRAVTVHLPPELIKALDAAAKAEGIKSRSEMIRRLCWEGLEQRGHDKDGERQQ